jgi:hypothetical protein
MYRSSLFLASVQSLCLLGMVNGQVDDLPLPQERLSGAPSVPPPFTPSPALDMPALPVPVTPVPSRVPTKSSAVPSSTSSSGQFIVYGPDLRVRSGIAGKCEDISLELGRLLRTPDAWVRTVVVQIKALTPADPPDLGISTQVSALTHGGFHLQMNVPERSGLRPADFRRELIRLLLSERILRSHKEVPDERSSNLLPPWVHTGVIKALEYRLRGRPSAEFAAIFKSGKVYGIEEILDAEATGLDGLSRTIYETSCCALVLAVLDQPDGPLRFSRFLAALAQEEKPQRELLKQWFPALAESDTSLNKWWSLQLASLAAPSIAETLDPTQTVELLDRALTFLVPSMPESKLPEPQKISSLASQRPAALKVPDPTIGNESTTSVAAVASSSTTKKSGPGKSSKPATKSVSSRPKDLPEAPEDAAEATEEEKSKKGFLRNFIPFMQNDSDKKKEELDVEEEGKGMTKTDDKVELSKEEASAAKDREKELRKAEEKEAKEKAAQEKADRAKAEKEKEAQEKREKDKARIEAAEARKATSMKEEASKSEPSPEKSKEKSAEPPAEGGRGKSLNPLKWFRGNKSSKDEAEAPGEKEVSVRLFDPAALDLENTTQVKVSRGPVSLGERGRYIQAPADQSQNPAESSLVPFPVEDFAVVMGHPEKQRLLSQMRLALQDVAVRGNVLFRDIANDYISVINELSVGKTKGADEKLKALRKRAVESYVKACAVQDHLDWYEATQSTRYSGLFEDFLTLPDRVHEELPPRNDPISKYLDEVEALLGR